MLQTRGDGVSIPEKNMVVISTSVDVLDDLGNNIGFLQQISRTDRRDTTMVRHLDSTDAGRMLEQAPGVETNELNVTGLALYSISSDKRSLLNRMAGSGSAKFKSLNSQQLPFEVTERWTHPATGRVGETLYGDCVILNYSRPVNIGTATITETCNIRATWVEG